MDLEEIKRYDDSMWLHILKKRTVFDTENIKAQKDWLIKQAEKLKAIEDLWCEIEFEKSDLTPDDFYGKVQDILADEEN
ncbi:MAG: hypothetical protein IJ880_04635 [Bacilli bacterium]|nr:hypothetical protein [Bacilli bacterium]MBR3119710.1 hypothetical protein [Oceanobacillus sp.]